MADRSVLYRIRAALQGGFVTVAQEVELLRSYVGVLNGVTDSETALQRLDGTGVGASIFRFTGSFSAQNSNIDDWFGGRQLTRLRCIDSGTGPGVSGAVPFTLPGATAINTAFDQLVTAGLPEQITFIIEYTGPSDDFLQIVPRSGTGNPVITGTSSITVRSGVAATIEVTRTSGTISDYTFVSIGGVSEGGNLSADSVKLINPSIAVWDASSAGILPITGVVKGNAYRVTNAPSDGSGRFGEVMQNNDWVVWNAETAPTNQNSWSFTPLNWFVIPAHDVRRITALESEVLSTFSVTPESDRNTVIRGSNYADTAGEIRLKLYAQESDYSAADLNTTGDIDVYTDPTAQTAYLAIRLSGTQATLASVLPTLYVYVDDGSGNFTRVFNLATDFRHLGDFTTESDYISLRTMNYGANTSLRIYVGTVQDRYNSVDLDVNRNNLSDELQRAIDGNHPSGNIDEDRLTSVESKVNALFPLTPDVSDLTDFASVYDPTQTVEAVEPVQGYSRMADYRGDATRYEQTGITYDNTTTTGFLRYTGMTSTLFRGFGSKVTTPTNKVLLYTFEGTERIPFLDVTSSGTFRVNNYTHSSQEGDHVQNQVHFLTRTAGDATLQAHEANVSTFTATQFPSGSTNASRTMQFEIDVLVNGVDTNAGHISSITLPPDNTAQARQTQAASIYLGPLHGGRTVDVTVSYELRVSGSDLLIDIRLVDAPSDVTVQLNSVATLLNYVAASTTTRNDNFIVFNDGAGDYTFTGENEILITFQPHTINNSMAVVAASRNADGTTTQMNDIETVIPRDTFEQIEVPDDEDFRMFESDHFLTHIDLVHLLSRVNDQWVYGLAPLRTIADRRITQPVDFTQGLILIGATNNTRVKLIVDDADTSNIKLGLQEE